MIVSEAIEFLWREQGFGNYVIRTHERTMRTEDIIHELEKVNQNLTVERFDIYRRGPVPEIYIVIDGRHQKGVT